MTAWAFTADDFTRSRTVSTGWSAWLPRCGAWGINCTSTNDGDIPSGLDFAMVQVDLLLSATLPSTNSSESEALLMSIIKVPAPNVLAARTVTVAVKTSPAYKLREGTVKTKLFSSAEASTDDTGGWAATMCPGSSVNGLAYKPYCTAMLPLCSIWLSIELIVIKHWPVAALGAQLASRVTAPALADSFT